MAASSSSEIPKLGHINYIEIGTSDFNTELQESPPGRVGLSVEPIKFYLDKLPNKDGCYKVNSAVSSTSGFIDIYYVKEEDITKYRLPVWARGCNSVGTYHKTIHDIVVRMGHDPAEVFTVDQVPVMTYPELIEMYGVTGVDLLKIDTEGHDCIVLESYIEACVTDPQQMADSIKFECNVLTEPAQVSLMISKLITMGYNIVSMDESDVVLNLDYERCDKGRPASYIIEQSTKARLANDNQQALALALEALDLHSDRSLEDMLTKPSTITDNLTAQIMKEITICSFYRNDFTTGSIGHMDIGLKASDLLSLYCSSQFVNHKWLRDTQRFYIDQLPCETVTEVIFNLPTIDGTDITWRPLNPSLLKIDDGYLVLVRTVNYTRGTDDSFDIHDDRRLFKTRNFLLAMSDSLSEMTGYVEIVDNTDRERYPDRFQGIEDCRLFTHDGQLCMTGSACDMTEINVQVITYAELGPISDVISQVTSQDVTQLELVRTIPLPSPIEGRIEKNWLPFSSDLGLGLNNSEIATIYGYSPFTIFKFDIPENAREGKGPAASEIITNTLISPQDWPFNSDHFKGSAGPVAFNYDGQDGYLIVVHETVLSSNEISYFHRFIFLDVDMAFVIMSNPFYFELKGVEFCSSIVPSSDGNSIHMGVGIRDQQAKVFTVTSEVIRQRLR